MQTVLVEHEGEIAWLTLNRPERRNAITDGMVEELLAALDLCQRRAVRVVILTGAGSAFCSGMDLEMLRSISQDNPEAPRTERAPFAGSRSRDRSDQRERQQVRAVAPPQQEASQSLVESRRLAHLFQRLYEFPAATIAAVNGAAVAGGCGLATLCDFTLCVSEARFGYPEVRIGFLPALVSVFLGRQIGEKRARDLLLSGRLIDAQEAAAWGLVNRVVGSGVLLQEARELASMLLKNSPTSIAGCKRLLARLPLETLEASLEFAAQENAAARETADFREGIAAFLEKRAPHWSHQPQPAVHDDSGE